MWAKRALLGLLFTALPVLASAQTSVIGIPPGSLMAPVVVFPASAVNGAGILSVNGIGTTSTAGFTCANNTPATVGVTVQMSPRCPTWISNAYNSTSGLSEQDSFFAEVLPATNAGTTTATWKLGVSINGGAATYPLTIQNNSNAVFSNGVIAGGFSTSANVTGGNIIQSGAGGSYQLPNGLFISSTAPSSPTACGAGTPSVSANNGTLAFNVTVGTGGSVSACTVAMPAATTGWNCSVNDLTTQSTSVFLQKQTASATNSVTVTNYNTAGAATAFVASDVLHFLCAGY